MNSLQVYYTHLKLLFVSILLITLLIFAESNIMYQQDLTDEAISLSNTEC